MSASLITPESRPKVATRPTGTSFLRLVTVEVRRLWWRRLTKAAVVGVIAFIAIGLWNAYQSSRPEELAQRLENYTSSYDQMQRDFEQQKAQLPEQIKQCKADQASERERSGDQSIDFGCDNMGMPQLPTPADFGVVPPVADTITADIAKQGYLLFAFLAFLLGASFIGAEFTSGSMGNWLTFAPRRVRVALSKFAAAAIGGAALAVFGLALATLGGRMIATVNRPDSDLKLPPAIALSESLPELLLRVLAVGIVAGIGGVALGLLLRHTAGILAALLGYGVVVEGFAAHSLFQGRLMPWVITTNLEAFINKGATYFAEACNDQGCQMAERQLTYTHSWIYLLGLGVAAIVIATLVFRRRDVT